MREYLQKTEKYLTEKLLPFWTRRIVEPKYGGYQANYDENGERTKVQEKALLAHGRGIFTLSFMLRQGYDWRGSRRMIRQGARFLEEHFHDHKNDGYFWIVDADGTPIDRNKVIYGHSFLIYGLAEHALATGDKASAAEACRIFDLVVSQAFDLRHGGFFEHFKEDWKLPGGGSAGGDLKSLDVHMHLLEAFTVLYELTRLPKHRRALEQVIEVIFERMVDAKSGLGVAMFTRDLRPVNNIKLDTVWGADRFDEKGKPPDVTSFGHNIELAWLYLHSQDILGVPRKKGLDRVLPIFEHTRRYGVDTKYGGLYVEGRRSGKIVDTDKEFWQQGEALVGFLDAYLLTKDRRYLEAFKAVYDFVFKYMAHPQLGEWYCLCGRDGTVKRPWLGSNWRIGYHTLRATTLVVKKLRQVVRAR
ncbi:MAG: AGE family epimerase/isomerase [Planctomycetota bacterium]|nr:AGE family epimerase/isomerase [Planctomycetota bacterium]